MRRVGGPETEVAKAPATDVALLLEAFEGEVYGSLGAADATHQFPCVKFLAGGTGQKCEKANLGWAPAEAGRAAQSLHVLDTNTIVLVSETL